MTASQIDENAIVDFVGANEPVGASAIGQHVGASGNPLSLKLKAMVDSGVLTKEGELARDEVQLGRGKSLTLHLPAKRTPAVKGRVRGKTYGVA